MYYEIHNCLFNLYYYCEMLPTDLNSKLNNYPSCVFKYSQLFPDVHNNFANNVESFCKHLCCINIVWIFKTFMWCFQMYDHACFIKIARGSIKIQIHNDQNRCANKSN